MGYNAADRFFFSGNLNFFRDWRIPVLDSPTKSLTANPQQTRVRPSKSPFGILIAVQDASAGTP
jgi:hypothetical protein